MDFDERSKGNRDRLPWKDDPQKFVLVQYGRLGEKRRDRQLANLDLDDMRNIYVLAAEWQGASARTGKRYNASQRKR